MIPGTGPEGAPTEQETDMTVWTADRPVPRREVWGDALRALAYHYYRAVVKGC
jgi:hypothetical protein